MEIVYFDEIDSTQIYLVDAIKKGRFKNNVAIVAKRQPKGVGSRGNSWVAQDGDLLFSFAIRKDKLPSDLPISSASIYFGYLLKESLIKFDKDIYLKWPNDIYKRDKKCGGVITNLTRDTYIVGVGLNLVKRDDGYGYLEPKIGMKEILKEYFSIIDRRVSWKQVFSKFKLEFNRSLGFKSHINGNIIDLKDAVLCEDGAILIDNERVYSLR